MTVSHSIGSGQPTMASNPSLGLLESARRWVLANLPYNRRDQNLVSYLSGLNATELLIAYHNWSSRLVRPQPRTVHRSAALQSNSLVTTQRAADLALLIDDIEKGRDLKKYLSRGVERSPVKVPGGSRPDIDGMLNDWRVHHLHISSIVESDGFVERDGPVLFVSFTPQDAYLIDIMPHGQEREDWTRNHVLEVLATEWPDKGVIHKIPNAVPTGQTLSDEERANLRANGYNASFEHDGSVYMPAGGMVSVGTTVAATRAAQQLVRQMEQLEGNYAKDPRVFARSNLALPQPPAFEFEIGEHGAGLRETQTSAWMAL